MDTTSVGPPVVRYGEFSWPAVEVVVTAKRDHWPKVVAALDVREVDLVDPHGVLTPTITVPEDVAAILVAAGRTPPA